LSWFELLLIPLGFAVGAYGTLVGAGGGFVLVPVLLLVGTVPHPAQVTSDQREMLSSKLPDFATDSVLGSGQYIQEEQPAAVLTAVTRLDEESP